MFYKPKYFKQQQLVPPQYVDMCWKIMDDRILRSADCLREKFGAIWINNYSKDFKYSGYRPMDCEVGKQYSQHKFGRALDLKFFNDVDFDEVTEFIQTQFLPISMVIVYDTFIHIDCRNGSFQCLKN